MIAQTDMPMLTPERVRAVLAKWYAGQKTIGVAFREQTTPANNPSEDYLIAYEVVFEPNSLDQALVEVSVTPEGNVAIGFETRRRVADRLQVSGSSDRFAAGQEPHGVSESALLAILDLIANGQIAVSPIVFPFFGLISTKAMVPNEALAGLTSKGYASNSWLNGISQSEFSNSKRLVRYQAWRLSS